MIRTILVDDEAPARDELRYLLEKNNSNDIEIIGEADNSKAAITLITNTHPDLIFLDIQMHGLNGLDLAEVITNIAPKAQIIFATAYDEFALKAFELQARDYIVKPIEEERLTLAIAHVKNHLPQVPVEATSPSIIQTLPSMDGELDIQKISVERDGHIILIPIQGITYFSSEPTHVAVHTRNGIYRTNKTLTELQNRLIHTSFFRVHRSFLVNLNTVQEIIPWFKGTYWLRVPDVSKMPNTTAPASLVDIPVSKTQVKAIKDILGI